MTTTTLLRPVGVQDLRLVLDADARAFPPRLPESAAPEARLPGAAARGRALSVLFDVWPLQICLFRPGT
jgi:hypothetical protein